ncbi:helix-turn-helix transcriptional regulator [Novosphingobium sp. HII-3]|uniref:helix-turn-helix domain-containing protein n=1 Tax=Novosphingobium sp. HII-3 TaxID=2075565 RepID=UPI000CDAFC15|nr:helix-turn-helix transcriptional regulator [Novosphingobium sp. HII-3]
MQLKDYLVEAGLTYDEFAKRIGAANAGVIAKYVARKRVPRPHLMAAIGRATEGKVQPNDFFAAGGD